MERVKWRKVIVFSSLQSGIDGFLNRRLTRDITKVLHIIGLQIEVTFQK